MSARLAQLVKRLTCKGIRMIPPTPPGQFSPAPSSQTI